MIDGLGAEFPELARLVGRSRRLRLVREPAAWAFVSANGAAFLTTAVLSVVIGAVFPLLFPPTREHPDWLRPAAISSLVSLVVAGAVALRAGGPAAVLLYVGYQLLTFAAGIPGRLTLCERSPGGPLPIAGGTPDTCDQLATLIAQWPELAALSLGVLLARAAAAPDQRTGANRTLRGAGAFVLVLAALSGGLGLVFSGSRGGDLVAMSGIVFAIYGAAGAVAGLVLARVTLARAALVALLVPAPTLMVNLPLLRGQLWSPASPETQIAQAAALLAPVLASALLLALRAYRRRARASVS